MVIDSLRARSSGLPATLQQALELLGQAQIAHSQQPILYDALRYLEQVRDSFSEHQETYDIFIDIMRDFKRNDVFLTFQIIQRVLVLFKDYPALIQDFNMFLPQGHGIGPGPDGDTVVTTPRGTMRWSPGWQFLRWDEGCGPMRWLSGNTSSTA